MTKKKPAIIPATNPEISESSLDLRGIALSDLLATPLVAVLSLSTRTTNCLAAAEITLLGELVSCSPRRLLALKNMGRRSLAELELKIREIGLTLGTDYANPPPVTPSIYDAPLKDVLTLKNRAMNILNRLDIHTVRQLAALSELRFLGANGAGATSLNEIKSALGLLNLQLGMTRIPESREISAETTQIPAPLQDSLVEEEEPSLPQPVALPAFPAFPNIAEAIDAAWQRVSARHKKVLVYFCGEKRPRTLEQTGRHFKVSRERIRQMNQKALKSIAHFLQFRGWGDSHNKLKEAKGFYFRESGGISFLDIERAECLSHMKLIQELSRYCPPLYFDSTYDVWRQSSTELSEILAKAAEQITEPISLDDLAVLFRSSLKLPPTANTLSKHLAEHFISLEMSQLNPSSSKFILRHGTQRSLVGFILQDQFPEGTHFSEIARAISRTTRTRGTPPRNVLATISLHPDILLWGKGCYTHKKNVHIKPELLQEIGNKIDAMFLPGIKLVSVTAAFMKHRSLVLQAGIPNAQALYSCLRWQHPGSYLYRHYPDIESSKSRRSPKVGRVAELENILARSATPLSIAELISHLGSHRRVQEYQITQRLPESSVVAIYNTNIYIHKASLGLTPEIEESVQDQTLMFLGQGRLFANLKTIRLNLHLPDLKYPWTLRLLGDILEHSPKLSRYRNLIYAGQVQRRKDMLELLVSETLSRASGIGLTLPELNKCLISEDFIDRPLAPSTLKRMKAIDIADNFVTLKPQCP